MSTSCDITDSVRNGGLDYVFEFAEKHAICSEEGYPYAAQDGSWSSLRVCPPTVTTL